jgi:hypothetical protein
MSDKKESAALPERGEAQMTRVEVYTIAIRAINQKMGTVKRRRVRRSLELARDFLANDPAFQWGVERVLLAKLASETPQFDNPLVAWKAQEVRDEILGGPRV